MISIIDDIRCRIERSIPPNRKEAVLRRCKTELRRTPIPKDKKPPEPVNDDCQALRRELSASHEARKSLERMFSSLGKEKEIMAAELARKVQEISCMEEDINDLKVRNERLLQMVQHCAAEHKEQKIEVRESSGNQALQERNKRLSEQLLKSLDGYRSQKRKMKEAQEENARLRVKMVEIAQEVVVGQEKIHGFRERFERRKEKELNVEEELSAVESLFQRFEVKATTGWPKRSECKPKPDMMAEKSPLLA
ncbi:microtubule-associated protein 70-1-like [Aristolochia californica]|uniref:microtubule-associated protein 70-1-like n=1 Tax=Aristolochia californica TaxID=171875 RepID=UPI0035E2424A